MNKIHRNIPRGDDKTPFSYDVEKMVITNSAGEEADLRELGIVESFSIVEELHQAFLVFSMGVRDDINFYDEFDLKGEEVIEFTLTKKRPTTSIFNFEEEEKIALRMSVKEYSNFSRETKALDTVEYNIICIAPHAYLSGLKNISRAFQGSTSENIFNIFERDLGKESFKIHNRSATQFQGIITTRSPLKGIEFLRARSFDEESSPFFLTHKLDNDIHFESYLNMTRADVYPGNDITYTYRHAFKEDAQTIEEYEESRYRVIELISNVKLDKLASAQMGAYGSKLESTDISTKSFSESRAVNDGGKIEMFLRLASSKEGPIALALEDAKIQRAQNDSATFSSSAPASQAVVENVSSALMFLASMDAEVQNIVVPGDFNLSCGKRINVNVPLSYNDNVYNAESDPVKTLIDGNYLITTAIHIFSNGKHTTSLKLISTNV